MNKRMVWALIAGPGLAMASLLLVFFVLGRSTVEATHGGAGAVPDLQPQIATFTVSGTVTCQATGPISDVEVYAWNRDNGTGFVGGVTDSSGAYRVTLEEGNYRLEFTPPPAAELNAKAFTTTQIMTDTVLDVNFCVCSGAWVTETVDGVGNVGNGGDTSLALAPTYPYTPHISYSSVSSQGVKHAWLSGAIWLSDTVYSSDTVDPQERNKGPISLALVPTYPYTPCIAYHDRACHDTGCSGVWFACWDGTTWVSQVVEAGHFQGQYGVSLALEPVYPYTPHISYHLLWSDNDLKYAYLSGTAWMSGTWVITTVDSAGAVGTGNSLALEQTHPYTPHISYYDGTKGDLKHAWRSGTTWLSETVDSEGDVGGSTSLALDSDGDPHIGYLDSTNLYSFDLKYAWLSSTTWLTETVDSEGDVGWFTSLALDGHGNPHISYYSRTPGGLRYARFDGGVWIVQTVDGGIDVGRHSSLALDPGGCPHISYYDAPRGELEYAHIPPRYLYLPMVMRNGR